MIQLPLALNKTKQEDIVYDIIRTLQPVRTEQVKIQAMYYGVSCADRYLRWLQESGTIKSYKAKDGDRTKTWIISETKSALKGGE